MLLAIDAGNSFIKWGYHDGSGWQAQGRAARQHWCATPEAHFKIVPDRIIIANVAGPEILLALDRIFPEIDVKPIQASSRAGSVINHYKPAESLGADRWASLIAARALMPDGCVVASLGTAMTVDALSKNGEFLGGMIAPGRLLMRKTVSEATHALPNTPGKIKRFPTCTIDAIESGITCALLGVVERVAHDLEQQTDTAVSCLLTGGDAATLSPWLNRPHQVVDNLVLQGLLRLAQDEVSK